MTITEDFPPLRPFGEDFPDINPESADPRIQVNVATNSISDKQLSGTITPTSAASGDLTGTYPSPTIGADKVTYAKMQNVSATSRILGRITAGAGDTEELTATQVASLMVATDLPAHGAGQHTDITRTLWLPCASGSLDGSTLVNVGATTSQQAVHQYADLVSTGTFWNFSVPADWTSGSLTAIVRWAAVSGAVTGTARWSFETKEQVAGDTLTTAGTTKAFTGVSAAHNADILVIEDAQTLNVTPTAAGTSVRLSLRRIGGNANDTMDTIALNCLGVLISYTANQ